MKHKNIYSRLRRIEGQIRGIEEMIEKGRSEQEIMIQLQAAKSSIAGAITSFVEGMLTKNEKGEVIVPPENAATILRLLKNS
ncbi:MAG: metal-sensing transcriptional repressor [Patescibacteria group bacterium]